MPAGEVDDRQSPKAQADSRRAVMALVVRAAMHDGVGHGLQDTAVDGGLPVRFENAADSAHGVLYRDGGSHQSHYRQTFVNFLTTPHHGVDRKLLPDAA